MGDQFVKIRPSTTRPITWTMSHDGQTGSGKNFPAICLPKHSGAHLITFTIDNPDGMEIEFSDDPIWIQEGRDCPKTAVFDKKQIKAKTRLSDSQLLIKDINKGGEVTLTYQLNFVDRNDASHKVPPLDPQIKNGGGNGPGQGFELEARQGLVVVSLLFVGFVAYRLLLDR